MYWPNEVLYTIGSYLRDLWQHSNVCFWITEVNRVLLVLLELGTGLLKADWWNLGLTHVRCKFLFAVNSLYSTDEPSGLQVNCGRRADRSILSKPVGFLIDIVLHCNNWLDNLKKNKCVMWDLRTWTTIEDSLGVLGACSRSKGLAFP